MSELRNKSICPSCKKETVGNYCNHCSEKLVVRNYSVREFISNIFEGFFSFDSKIFRSLKTLFFNPGKLTNEFLAGSRVKYMKPFQLFIIMNIIMFFTSLYFSENLFSSSLNNQRNFMPYSGFVKTLTDGQQNDLNLTYETYESKFNLKLENYSKTLIMLIIPFLAFAVKLTQWKRYYVEHLVYSTHYFTFVLFLLGIIIIPVSIILSIILNYLNTNLGFSTDIIIVPFILISFTFYFYLSIRKVYNDTIIISALKSIFLFVVFMMLFIFYRFLLFLFVYSSFLIFG